ncbi:sugar phosphate isomerase/epimerase family protein [Thermorudis peleae]|uniref:sugar phosphate isomerase/epimerase family protein n=1 Tax=Thermorudis peleae TaxID=1382356 RepID=UPI00056E2AC4|nr:sugar phosphate isomerase/epimerase [Thermorudis peleae]
MERLRFGNAPCSWGIIEGISGDRLPYYQMLDELVEAGYEGTELGDYGYLPTDPEVLRAELDRRGLTLLGAFVMVALTNPHAHREGIQQAVRTATLLAQVADIGDPHWRPLLILSDAHSFAPVRLTYAGRIRPEMSLTKEEWNIVTQGIKQIVQAVRETTGIETVFHPHCASYVETPDEIAQVLGRTEIGLVFDTGHYFYGSGGLDASIVLEGVERFGPRIRYVHLKDVDPTLAARARSEGWDYQKAVRSGLFCELGKGAIEFGALIQTLLRLGYHGWITVEQDVVPGTPIIPRESAWRSREYLRKLTGW